MSTFALNMHIEAEQIKQAVLQATVNLGIVLMCTVVYLNYVLLQPYIRPLFWSVVFSVPLHAIKNEILIVTVDSVMDNEHGLSVARVFWLGLKLFLRLCFGDLYRLVSYLLRSYLALVARISAPTPVVAPATTSSPSAARKRWALATKTAVGGSGSGTGIGRRSTSAPPPNGTDDDQEDPIRGTDIVTSSGTASGTNLHPLPTTRASLLMRRNTSRTDRPLSWAGSNFPDPLVMWLTSSVSAVYPGFASGTGGGQTPTNSPMPVDRAPQLPVPDHHGPGSWSASANATTIDDPSTRRRGRSAFSPAVVITGAASYHSDVEMDAHPPAVVASPTVRQRSRSPAAVAAHHPFNVLRRKPFTASLDSIAGLMSSASSSSAPPPSDENTPMPTVVPMPVPMPVAVPMVPTTTDSMYPPMPVTPKSAITSSMPSLLVTDAATSGSPQSSSGGEQQQHGSPLTTASVSKPRRGSAGVSSSDHPPRLGSTDSASSSSTSGTSSQHRSHRAHSRHQHQQHRSGGLRPGTGVLAAALSREASPARSKPAGVPPPPLAMPKSDYEAGLLGAVPEYPAASAVAAVAQQQMNAAPTLDTDSGTFYLTLVWRLSCLYLIYCAWAALHPANRLALAAVAAACATLHVAAHVWLRIYRVHLRASARKAWFTLCAHMHPLDMVVATAAHKTVAVTVGLGMRWVRRKYKTGKSGAKEVLANNANSFAALFVLTSVLTIGLLLTAFIGFKIVQETSMVVDASVRGIEGQLSDDMREQFQSALNEGYTMAMGWIDAKVSEHFPQANITGMYSRLSRSFTLPANGSLAMHTMSTTTLLGGGLTKDPASVGLANELAILTRMPHIAQLLAALMAGNFGILSDRALLSGILSEVKDSSSTLITTVSSLVKDSSAATGYASMVLGSLGTFGVTVLVSSMQYLLDFFDLIFQIVLFLVTLHALLSRETAITTWFAQVLILADPDMELTRGLEDNIISVLACTTKMTAFHSMLTWLTFSAWGVDLVYVSVFLTAALTVIPVIPPFWLAVPAAFSLYWLQSRFWAAVSLLVIHVYAGMFIDSSFFAEITDVSPAFSALAFILGLYAFGLEGLVLGPLLMSVIPTVFSIVSAKLALPGSP
ncbi:hypothetical protein BC828DRAFT_402648 [Blastocladiella britannica]|nr:hypothetical protein BC828DRAFT_402648 [Blastocladiella britannica]